jgi:hypothetical protein
MELRFVDSTKTYQPKTISITVESEEEEHALIHIFGCWNGQNLCGGNKEKIKQTAQRICDGLLKNNWSTI